MIQPLGQALVWDILMESQSYSVVLIALFGPGQYQADYMLIDFCWRCPVR